MGRRAELSTVLLVGAIVLLISIGVGMSMGERVLGQIGLHVPVQPTPVPALTAAPDDRGDVGTWKRVSVMAAATDPGFPDPRVPPPPEYTPAPRPRPTLEPERLPATPRPTRNPHYTSPPLPIPLVTHTPEAPAPTPTPESEPTPRPYLTLPPVPIPSVGN